MVVGEVVRWNVGDAERVLVRSSRRRPAADSRRLAASDLPDQLSMRFEFASRTDLRDAESADRKREATSA
jgi:hypothetical protein